MIAPLDSPALRAAAQWCDDWSPLLVPVAWAIVFVAWIGLPIAWNAWDDRAKLRRWRRDGW